MFYRNRYELRESQQQVKTLQPKDDRQKEILANMYYAACDLIGGLENCLQDYDPGDAEYEDAADQLGNHEVLVGDVEAMCRTGFYGCGMSGPQQEYQRHYNLAGNAYISQCAEAVVVAMGY